MRSGNRQNQQEIEKNRATPHHENDPESALPKPKKPNDQNEISNFYFLVINMLALGELLEKEQDHDKTS